MAELLNMLPVLGVVKITDSRLIYNGLPVRGVRVSADAFAENQVVRGVDVLTDGDTLHNDARVIGVSVISDAGQTMFNDAPVMPVTVVSGSLA